MNDISQMLVRINKKEYNYERTVRLKVKLQLQHFTKCTLVIKRKKQTPQIKTTSLISNFAKDLQNRAQKHGTTFVVNYVLPLIPYASLRQSLKEMQGNICTTTSC